MLCSCSPTPSSQPEPSPYFEVEVEVGERAAEHTPPLRSGTPLKRGVFPAHLDTALAYVGTWEDLGNNRGTDVNRFLAVSGLGGGYPWCAAFVAYCLENAVPQPVFPATRSPGARHYINRRSIPVTEAVRKGMVYEPGTILIWLRDNGPAGHVGFIRSGQGGRFLTVEGNTSPNEEGDQRDGGVVALKERRYSVTARLKMHFVTPVEYRDL